MPVERAAGCVLAGAGSGPPCPCERLGGELRTVLGVALPLNRSNAADLARLPGIGPARAGAIVAEREHAGPFASPDELVRVSGIGAATVARLRPHVFASGPDPACEEKGIGGPRMGQEEKHQKES